MKAVASGECGINREQCSIMHGVPRATLKDRLSVRVEHGRKPGPAPCWSAVEFDMETIFTAHVRMDAINEQSLKQYFDLLEDTMKQHNLFNHPAQIYNVDESRVSLDPKAIASNAERN